MKKIILAVIILVVGAIIYKQFLQVDILEGSENKQEKKELIVEKQNSISKVENKTSKNLMKKIETIDKEEGSIISDSKTLKDLIIFMHQDRDNFHQAYSKLVVELKNTKDHTSFYEQFKNLFISNDLQTNTQQTLLTLLIDVGTKESTSLLFEMIDDGTIENENIIGAVANNLKRGKNPLNQYEKDGEFMSTLVSEYPKIDNQWMMIATAKVIGDSSRDDAIEILVNDYVEALTPERKGAARAGLMEIHGKDPLPVLSTYLNSEDKNIHQVGAMVLSNIASNQSSESLSSWVMEKATIDDAEEIKKWYKYIINTRGIYRVTKNIVLEKIRDEALQDELNSFLEEQTRSYEEMIEKSKH